MTSGHLWEQAVIEHCVGDYWLREIFKVEAELRS